MTEGPLDDVLVEFSAAQQAAQRAATDGQGADAAGREHDDRKDSAGSAATEETKGQGTKEDHEDLYTVRGGRICRRGSKGQWAPLCNFTATITEEVTRDDGATEQSELRITGTLAGGVPLGTAEVPLERFAAMTWPITAWGTRATVSAGMGAKDQLREALQTLSTKVVRRRMYAHTGWRKIDGTWCFLHAGGAIGLDGPLDGIEVGLDKELERTVLPAPADGPALAAAVRASLDLMALAPDPVMAAVLGCAYRAPLSHALAMDASVHLHGGSGNFKTELAALAMAHFGDYDRLSLPGAWASTGNSLELLAFLGKDIVVVIDDFAPTGTAAEIAKYHATADRVLRGVGNQAGRGRMSADGRLRPQYAPRGVVLSTGEDVPRGHSLGARLLVVDVARSDVDLRRLTQAQHQAAEGTYAAAMAGYVRWLSSRFEDVRKEAGQRFAELRTAAHSDGAHARLASTQAHIHLGWDLWVRFATECGACTQDEAAALLERVRGALAQLAAQTQRQLATHDPAQRFVELLAALLASGKAHLAGPGGGAPADPERWGWEERAAGEERTYYVPLVPQRIGWVEGDQLYLEPDATYASVQRFAGEQGESLPLQPKTLWKRLSERGLLASWDADGRHTVKKVLGGNRVRVLHLAVTTLEGGMCEKSGQSGHSGQPGSTEEAATREDAPFDPSSAPIRAPIIGPAVENRGTKSGHEVPDAGTTTPVEAVQPPLCPECPDCPDFLNIGTPRVHETHSEGARCSTCRAAIPTPTIGVGVCRACRAAEYARLGIGDDDAG